VRLIRAFRHAGSAILFATTFVWPWPLRRILLGWLYGYRIHPEARIGFAWVRPKKLVMGRRASIGNLTLCKGLELLELGDWASIGKLNWITGFPAGHPVHFACDIGRIPSLILGDHSAITNRHILDCTSPIRIGKFTTVAGFRSVFLTHSIDLGASRQSSKPIEIGDYAFVGTSCVVLGGSRLPSRCVLGAGSVLNKSYVEELVLYAGVPARSVKILDADLKYFLREVGYVD